MNESRYSRDRDTEEDKEFFDKYAATGESEWSRGSTTPFDQDVILSERHYQLGHTSYDRPSQFSRPIPRDYAGVGPLNYRRSDVRILDDSSDALYRSPEVDASDIEVSVKDGVVTLKGTVESRVEKKVAEMAVEGLPGVVDVDNRLVIEKPRRQGLMEYSPIP